MHAYISTRSHMSIKEESFGIKVFVVGFGCTNFFYYQFKLSNLILLYGIGFILSQFSFYNLVLKLCVLLQ